MDCEGCKLNILNQLAHIDGCLKSKNTYFLDVYPTGSDDTQNSEDFLVQFYSEDFIIYETRMTVYARPIYAYQKAVIEALDRVEQYWCKDLDTMIVNVSSFKVIDVLLHGKCYSIPDYTFHLKFKTFGINSIEQKCL